MNKKALKNILVWIAISCGWGYASFGYFDKDNYFWGITFAGLAIAGFIKVILIFMYRKNNSK